MLDAASGIVVGRVLSSYTTGGIQDNRLTIDYSVYNQEPAAVSGVLLTTTLAQGVNFVDAPLLQPDRNGQELAWSLGTIEAYGRATVRLTVSLPTTVPLQIDAGASAFATLDARAVSDDAPAATLRPGSVPAELLASTPDANTTDPFVQEKAAALDYDPQRIIDYLQDEVGYESYTGSLRGARGALWSAAGNALDEASLGVALFRASGIPARYAQGTLSDALSRQLILSMFPANFQTVGYVPAGTELADPANDPQLLAETRQHYWIQFDTGGGLQDVDTTFANAIIGQTFTPATGTFAEVADGLRHKVTVRLNAETFGQASAALTLGSGLSTATVLNQTFATVDLVGKSLTIGNFVDTTVLPSPVFVARTTNYTPYLIVGGNGFDPTFDELITGTSYQEVQTNFPLGNRILTGLFLEVTVTAAGGAARNYSRTLADRIGIAARATGGSTSVDPDGPPLITALDSATLSVMPGEFSRKAFQAGIPQLAVLQQALLDAEARLAASPLGPAHDALVEKLATAFQTMFTAMARSRLAQFHVLSDSVTQTIEQESQVRAYFDSPRVTIFSTRGEAAPGEGASVTFSLDLRKDDIRAIAFPGNSQVAALAFNITRGMGESELEAMAVGAAPQLTDSNLVVNEPVSTSRIFAISQAQGIPPVALTTENSATLDSLAIPADAKTLITVALQRGMLVLVPASTVLLNGQQQVGWLEINQITGETIGVLQGGQHGATTVEYFGTTVQVANQGRLAQFSLGALTGLSSTSVTKVALFLAKVVFATHLNSVDPSVANQDLAQFKQMFISNVNWLKDVILYVRTAAPRLFIAGFTVGFILSSLLSTDPPAEGYHSDPRFQLFPPPPNVATSSSAASSSLSPGVVNGNLESSGVQVEGQLAASWASQSANAFRASTVDAPSATVTDALGNTLGSGAVSLAVDGTLPVSVSGNALYGVDGLGSLSFYAPATTNLGVSGTWDGYTARVSGSVILKVTTDALMLNGALLPFGTYTIMTGAVTLSGNGATAAPDFAGTASVTAANARLVIGRGSGTASVGGTPLDAVNGFSLTGYTGTIALAAGATTDSVGLNGTAAGVLRVAGNPATLVTGQNTATTFAFGLETSQSDTYTLIAEAPTGWAVTVDGAGVVTVIPAPGLQGGTFAIRLTARSQTNPDLVAHGEVLVTVTATQPGVTLAVNPDPLFTVPFNGAQVPAAFRAAVHNLGPAADTFILSVPNPPAGFNLLRSGTQLTVPAGETGILGLYLEPTTQLPPPDTLVTFDVTATSTTNPAITQTRTVTFTVPAIHGVTLTADRLALAATPGTAANVTLTLKSVGNVAETVSLTATLSTGLTLGGLTGTVPLALGGSQPLNLTLTPAANVPLNSTLSVTFTATFAAGELGVQTIQIPVRVVAPGADAAANAAASVSQSGLTDLANRLGDLATALTNLFGTPGSAGFKSQAIAALDAVAALVAADFFFAPLVPPPLAARDGLVAAVTPDEVRAALGLVGDYLTALEPQVTAVARHGFEAGLFDNAVVVQPNVVNRLPLFIRNTGTQTTTYDLAQVGGFGDPGFFRNGQFINSVTLQPGQVIAGGDDGISLLFNSGTTVAFNVDVIVTARPAPQLVRRTTVSVTQRPEFVSVAAVVATPPFTNPGGQVALTARLVNGLNDDQQVRLTYAVTDAQSNVVFTSGPTLATLAAQGTTLTDVSLPALTTTGLALGEYTVTVTVTTPAGAPIPGGSGSGRVRVGTPVTASLSVSPDVVTTGNRIVVNTLTINAQAPLADPLTLVAQEATTPRANSVIVVGSVAYVAGTDGIDVIDVSNPLDPVLVRTFAQNEIVRGGFTIVRDLPGDFIAVASTVTLNATGFDLLVYDVSNPLNPALVSDTAITQRFMTDLAASGSTALVTTFGDNFFGGNPSSQIGDVTAINLSAAPPTVTDRLLGTGTPPSTGDSHHFGIALADADTAYVAGTTLSQFNFSTGTGRLRVVNFADPANLALTRDVQIPGTLKLYDVALDGNLALVVGTNGPDGGGITGRFNTGFLTLTTLDVSDRDNPVVLSTEITQATFSPENTQGGFLKLSVVPVGNGRFAVSRAVAGGTPVILLVDASNPLDVRTSALPVTSVVDEMTASGGRLFTVSAAGLLVYEVGQVQTIPLTASLRVPFTGGSGGANRRPNTFNLAPDRIIPGNGFETLEWDRVLGAGLETETFTFEMNVNPSEGGFTQTAQGGTVTFTSQGTPGTVTLPPVGVSALSFLSLTPAAQEALPGAAAQYTLSINEPFLANSSLNLIVTGLPASWVNVPATIVVNAQGMGSATLTVTPDALANPADYGFTVEARISAASRDVVGGKLTVTPPPATDPEARGIVVQLMPSQASAGQGTAAVYTARLTNTGSVTDTFRLSVTDLPGVTEPPEQTVEVPPGASNFRDVRIILTPAVGTAAGSLPFTVTATSTTHQTVTDDFAGTLNVLAAGVDVEFMDGDRSTPGTFAFMVTNTGGQSDTFDLELAGPAALVAQLRVPQVTLGPGASQVVQIDTSEITFAYAGGLNLTAIATSQTNTAVKDGDTTAADVPEDRGVTARFDPVRRDLPAAGSTTFLLLIDNVGNVEEAFEISITGTSGPLTASLDGLDGTPTQTIPVARIPGLQSGAVLLRVNATDSGMASVTVRVRSEDGVVSTTATANLTVVNNPPVAVANSYSTDEDVPLMVAASGVLGNDSDADGDLLTALLVSGPANGTLALNADGSFRYTPNANYNGPDSFTYRASDGEASSNVATVSITVRPVNDAPVAMNDSYATDEDVPLTVSVPGVLGNDTDVDSASLSVTLVGNPQHGTLTPNADGSFSYTPTANYNGDDGFTYRANDGAADSTVATVSITVKAVNDAPVAASDSYATNEDVPLMVSAPGVLGNDADVDTLSLTVMLVNGPAHGTLTLNGDGSFVYVPNENYNGPDSFTYRASDGSALSDPVTVSLTVNPVNDAPIANPNQATTAEDRSVTVNVVANDTDADGDALTVTAIDATGTRGKPTNNGNGTITYDPAGAFDSLSANQTATDTFRYTVSDGRGGTSTATVTVTVTGVSVDGPNPPPLPPVQPPPVTAPPPDLPAVFTVATSVGARGGKVTLPAGSSEVSVTPFAGFAGEVRVARGDLNGDGTLDTIYAAGPGATGGHVKAVDGATGQEAKSFLAFDGFSGGANVGSGDVNGDGVDDVIVGAGAGALGGHVKAFDGRTGALLRSFFAFDGFPGEVRVAGGDVNGDGFADVIVGAGAGHAGGHVKAFDGRTGALLRSFFAFDGFAGGTYVGAADLDGDGTDEILAGADAGAQPHVKAFGVADQALMSFLAYLPQFRGGVRVAGSDVNGDGREEVVTGNGFGQRGHVTAVGRDGLLASLFAGDESINDGLFVG